MIWRALGLFALSGILFACSDGEEHASGIWDETQNGLAIHIVDSTGTPVANARLRIINADGWAKNIISGNTIADSAITNASGIASLKKVSATAYAEVSAKSGVSRIALANGDTAKNDTLRTASTLNGVLNTASLPREVRLYGTSFRAAVNADGSFTFDSIPGGDYAVVIPSASAFTYCGGAVADTASTVTRTFTPENADSVLIDDFEDGNNFNRFHAITGGGWWYNYSDSTSSVSPEKAVNSIVRNDSGWNASFSYHATFSVANGVSGAFALCGFDIGVSPLLDTVIGYDLSSVDTISFYAKGTGHIKIQFYGSHSLSTDTTGEWIYEFDLSSEWTRIVVTPQGVPDWENIKSSITTITFMSTADADIWLDEIVFHGISPASLFPGALQFTTN